MKHPPYEDCPRCEAKGYIEVKVVDYRRDFFSDRNVTGSASCATGYEHKERWPCWNCNGNGHLPMKATGEY